MTLPKGFDPPPPLPNKKLRCKMGLHSFENKVRGKLNFCKICRRKYYVKTRKEIFDGEPHNLGWSGGLEGGP